MLRIIDNNSALGNVFAGFSTFSAMTHITSNPRYDTDTKTLALRSLSNVGIPLRDDWNVGDNYKEDAIFNGKGYLRAEYIQPDKAKISIWRQLKRIISKKALYWLLLGLL